MPTITKKYILLDSTGIRRPSKRTFGAETNATYRTIEAAYEADVICLVLDGSEPISHQDQVVAGIAKEAKKGLVVIVNKSDLVDVDRRKRFIDEFNMKFGFLKVDKFLWVSAKENLESVVENTLIPTQNLKKNPNGEELTNREIKLEKNMLSEIWESIDQSLASRNVEIDKIEIRKLFNYLMKQKPPKKQHTKKRPIVYDLLYTRKAPPTFDLLVKDKETIHPTYLNFIENMLRKQFGFVGTRVVVRFREVKK